MCELNQCRNCWFPWLKSPLAIGEGWFSAICLLITLKKWLSKTLLIIGRSEIGLKSEEFWALGFFGMGTTEEVFHPDGVWPHRIEQLKRLVMEGAIAPAVCFISIRAEKPSGPLDLEVSRDFNNSWIWLSEHRREAGTSPLVEGTIGQTGGTDWLKH